MSASPWFINKGQEEEEDFLVDCHTQEGIGRALQAGEQAIGRFM
jgi:hypothetical protein